MKQAVNDRSIAANSNQKYEEQSNDIDNICLGKKFQ